MPWLQLTRDQRHDCQLLHSIGWKYNQIQEKTGFSQHQIQYACTSPATPTKRSGRPPTLSQAQIEDPIGYVCMSARNRRLSFQQLADELDFGVGRMAIRAALVKEGFHRRLAMRKPPISESNRVIRLQLAQKHVNWTQLQWNSILWTDETWITGGRLSQIWLSKADSTWLIVISQRYVYVSRYWVSWLIVFHMTTQ